MLEPVETEHFRVIKDNNRLSMKVISFLFLALVCFHSASSDQFYLWSWFVKGTIL